jgi:phosphatidylinositol-3-phosphatase
MRVAASLAFAALVLGTGAAGAAGADADAPPPIRHVFVLVLENKSYATTFARDSPAPYLAHTLPAQGALLENYYAIGHASLGNYVAMISGQAPNIHTQLDCPTFVDFKLASPRLDPAGQALGSGCVYPPMVRTLPDQLEAAHLSWRAYMEDMGNDPKRERTTCGHARLGAADGTESAQLGDQYAAKHNPFVYFHSIIDDQARCDAHVVNLARLAGDLGSIATTANLSFITPNLCNDGHDPRCVDGRRGGLAAIDAFLAAWVPLIQRSPAFRADGLLIVTFDESDGAGPDGSSACCGERGLPGAKFRPGFSGPGGGRIGAVLLSPFVRPGIVSAVPYNHYSLLKTVEAIFGLPPLGYAGQAGLAAFGADVFSAPARRPPAR